MNLRSTLDSLLRVKSMAGDLPITLAEQFVLTNGRTISTICEYGCDVDDGDDFIEYGKLTNTDISNIITALRKQ